MRNSWLRLVVHSLAVVSLLLLIGASAILSVWYGRGGRLLSVQTGSMVPTFWPGDAVFVQKQSLNKLQVGDIISYHATANPKVVYSHRIVAVHTQPLSFVTQGDHLTKRDPTVTTYQVIGRVVAVAPHFGQALRLLRRPVGLVLAIYVPAAVIITAEVRRFYARQDLIRYRIDN